MGRLFPALLRYWRRRRGLSQLDLALTAGVSARHLSFLESGRAAPSEGMALRLLDRLAVPLRDQNQALRAAGFPARFPEPPLDQIPAALLSAIDQMMAQHEPYPLTVQRVDGTIERANRSATLLFPAFMARPEAMPATPDMFALLFDPRLMRPFVEDWEGVARGMIGRLHRERLIRGDDPRLDAALDRALGWPDVPRGWREPDLAAEVPPTFTVRLARGELRVGFLLAVTVFSAPQQVTLDELRLESAFPLDDETRRICSRLGTQPQPL